MTIDEENRKLQQISKIQSVEELDGWEFGMKTRPQIRGEQAALTWRRVELQSKRTA